MTRALSAVLACSLALVLATSVEAKVPSAGNPCPAPNTTFLVFNPVGAALISDGFDCKHVDLQITNVTVTPTVATLVLAAKTIAVTGSTIVNSVSSDSKLFLTAEGGGMAILNSTLRSNNHLILECKAFSCDISILGSVVSAPINNLLTTGDTRAIAHGDITIENSTFFGKNKVGVLSAAGKVTWHCISGQAGGQCVDPTTDAGRLAQLCPNGFPCQLNLGDIAALSNVCTKGAQAPNTCGGGESECQVTAFLDVDLEDSVITCDSHFSVTSKTGSIFAAGAVLVAKDALTLQAKNGVFAPGASLASLLGAVTLETKGGIPAPGVCIDVSKANVSKPRFFLTANACTVDQAGLTP